MPSQVPLLVAAVIVVGVLHTLVPDHWAPIVVIARQRGWSRGETVRAAMAAGAGHTLTTLMLGAAIWFAGAELSAGFGHLVDVAASLALVAFGLWVAVGSYRERSHSHGHHHGHGRHAHHDHHHHAPAAESDGSYQPLKGVPVAMRHVHVHRHGRGLPHVHWHDHDAASSHQVSAEMTLHAPLHDHRHRWPLQAKLMILLGSSPMVEGLPAFFAASRYSVFVLAVMAMAFAASTIATYAILCSVSLAGLQRVRLGPLEAYGEVIAGAFIAALGILFLIWPIA